jgi:hypothetical protein
MIRIVHFSSWIWILTFYPSRIPDPGVKKAPDPGSQIRIRNTIRNQCTNSVELMPGVLKSLKIRAQDISPFTQT